MTVHISDSARAALTTNVRTWTGWPDATLEFAVPTASPFAQCSHGTRTITANPEPLVLNPNRVVLTVTPFRLRQEAVLTGSLLHEAGHARHSQWIDRSPGGLLNMKHDDGEHVTDQTLGLARLLEEPRIEGIMARHQDNVGAAGLGWTMRAAAAHLIQPTVLSDHEGQAIMDLIKSWTLRAGRQHALKANDRYYRLPSWVFAFDTLLRTTVAGWLEAHGNAASVAQASEVYDLLVSMAGADETFDTGTGMVDAARLVLAILFPETDGDDPEAPKAEPDCADETTPTPEDEGEEDGEDGQGDDESDDQGEGEGQDPDESDSPADGGSGDDEAEGEGEDGDSSIPSDADSDGEGEGDEGEPEDGDTSDLAAALAAMESEADESEEDDTPVEVKVGGSGGEVNLGGGFRLPTAVEREVNKSAERLLRGLIAPAEASKVMLTESPSATVDGGALAAWKAGGQDRDPRFFRRVKRTIQPSPPIKIAVLVDVSISMSQLQKPSALLSWALAAAAIDLRNFAGRGKMVESTLIHWGSEARVIQGNGQLLPGIREVDCSEGTWTMDDAHDLVEQEMPGFFDPSEDNRLLVHFTDWELSSVCLPKVKQQMGDALANGVNVLSIVPKSYSTRSSALNTVLAACPVQRGAHKLVRYNPMFPDQAWDEAAAMLK